MQKNSFARLEEDFGWVEFQDSGVRELDATGTWLDPKEATQDGAPDRWEATLCAAKSDI